MTDPWMITSRERVKYSEQFKSLQPNNGIVTGGEAKGFFLQSQLPPIVLGQIWALADTDCDGKMNLDEFSIACKLINLKLRGFEMPKVLPPTLLSSLSSVGGTPTRTPTAMSPLDPRLNRPAIPPQPVIPQTIVSPLATMDNMAPLVSQPPLIPNQPNMMGNAGYASIPPLIPPQPVMPSMPPLIPTQPLISMQPLIPIGAIPPIQPPLIPTTGVVVRPLIDTGKIVSPPNEPILPAPPTPPSGTPSRSMSISERAPSIESPNANVEWAVKGPAKLKYTQMFNTADKNRTGFLTGVQARSLMLQTKLHQTTLAQIWALSDMDSDGRLGCDEFVLAMYLCDMALQGEKIPTALPLELIPPTFRKTSSRHGSVSGGGGSGGGGGGGAGGTTAITAGSRHGSVSSQGGMSHVDMDPTAGLNQTTFEDKRKENFEKGQAELERRRKALLDQQRKEREERERKEREENDKREKARLEIELRKQQELDRQLQRQREIEQEKEEQRKRALEQKEAARKEMDRQRQMEWENQRIQDMQSQKQREQEKVLKLKAQNQNLNIELSTLNEKIKDLSQKICDTRPNVTNLKTVIDGMRQTRDSQNTELAQLRTKIKEQNQKLVHLSQEKAKLDAKNKASQSQDPSNPENSNVAFTNKQILIKQLKDKIQNTKEEIDTKMVDIKTNNETLTDVKTQLKGLLNSCEELYSTYDVQRNQIMEMKNNRKNESYSMAWDTNSATDTNAWPVETQSPVKTVSNNFSTTTAATTGASYMKYRALYEFAGRNEDEISFQPGDIIMVPTDLNMEAGWLAGEINGLTGYFPETYVEKIDSPTTDTSSYDNFIPTNVIEPKTPLEDIAETVEVIPNDSFNGNLENYVACFPYESAELGDLTFSVGEMIMVSKKVGEWWTGSIGTRTGIFPSNYVQPVDTSSGINPQTPTQNNTIAATLPTHEVIGEPQEILTQTIINGNNHQMPVTEAKPFVEEAAKQICSAIEEAKTQADADSEVSQINTQTQINEIVRDEFSRPMSTTSTTRNKKPEIAQVIAPYDATSTEQLTLQRGQLIMIRKKTDSGWWEGELQAKGRRRQIGWFPATYVKILQGGRNSGRNTPVSGARIEMSEQVLDKVIALYPYKALNDDELSFEKDDIISVLGRDEPEWWRGELNGITGLFPSNYVGPFVTSGKKKK